MIEIRQTRTYEFWFEKLRDARARALILGRESLYKALSTGGNPALATVLKVVRALGLKLHATASPHFSWGCAARRGNIQILKGW